MSETELEFTPEPDPIVARFTGDPRAAAALARRRSQSAWTWSWLCTLFAIGGWAVFGGLVSLAGAAAGVRDWTLVISLVAAVACSIVAGIFFSRVYSQRRVATMADVCDTMGFRFTEKADKLQLMSFVRIPLFRRGHGQKGYYLMEGEVGGWPVTAMEYYYTTGSGKSQNVHCQTVVIVHGADHLPAFELSPKSFWRKVGEVLGLVNISFASNPAFMSAYHISGPDEKEIRAAFTPATLAYFAERRNLTVDSHDGHLAVYQQDKAFAAEEYPVRVAAALAVLQQLHSGLEPASGADGEVATDA